MCVSPAVCLMYYLCSDLSDVRVNTRPRASWAADAEGRLLYVTAGSGLDWPPSVMAPLSCIRPETVYECSGQTVLKQSRSCVTTCFIGQAVWWRQAVSTKAEGCRRWLGQQSGALGALLWPSPLMKVGFWDHCGTSEATPLHQTPTFIYTGMS